MKIVIVGTAYPLRGGIAHYNAILYKHLSGRHSVEIVTFTRQYPSILFPGKTQDEKGGQEGAVPTEQLIDSINPWTWYTAAKAIVSDSGPGLNDGAMLRAIELSIGNEDVGGRVKLTGMFFKIIYKGSTVPVFLPGVLGRQHVYAALAGAAVGVGVGMNLVEVSERMHYYDAPPGRMKIIEGIKNTTLIDDTYNSSPTAAIAAVETKMSLAIFKKQVLMLLFLITMSRLWSVRHLLPSSIRNLRMKDIRIAIFQQEELYLR